MNDSAGIGALRANPALWMVWAVLGAAVTAGFTMLGISLSSADRALPSNYHWEGERLDADFARQRAAAAAGVAVTLRASSDGAACAATLNVGDPAALDLRLTHAVDAGQDRVVKLERVARGEYRGDCRAPAPGRWRVAIDTDDWALRGHVDGTLAHVTLRARSPDGG